jgi:ParB-like chromosome segregation protein Spo0J
LTHAAVPECSGFTTFRQPAPDLKLQRNKMLDITKIRIDGGTQSRVELDQTIVNEYAEAMQTGATFPPVRVFNDGATNWLADGFHRYFAVRKAGLDNIDAEIIEGTQRDAILYSLGANGKHGLRRTNADKRKAVETLLNDPEWSEWSNRAIAEAASVGEYMVRSMREKRSETSATCRKYITKHGTEAVMETANIGKNAQKQETDEPLPETAPTVTQDQIPPRSKIEELRDEQAKRLGQEAPKAPAYVEPSDEELEASIAYQEEEEKRVRLILESDEPLKALSDENQRLSKLNALLQTRIDGLMGEKAFAISETKRKESIINKLRKENEALQKQIADLSEPIEVAF